jgi:hypothetical protein
MRLLVPGSANPRQCHGTVRGGARLGIEAAQQVSIRRRGHGVHRGERVPTPFSPLSIVSVTIIRV